MNAAGCTIYAVNSYHCNQDLIINQFIVFSLVCCFSATFSDIQVTYLMIVYSYLDRNFYWAGMSV